MVKRSIKRNKEFHERCSRISKKLKDIWILQMDLFRLEKNFLEKLYYCFNLSFLNKYFSFWIIFFLHSVINIFSVHDYLKLILYALIRLRTWLRAICWSKLQFNKILQCHINIMSQIWVSKWDTKFAISAFSILLRAFTYGGPKVWEII